MTRAASRLLVAAALLVTTVPLFWLVATSLKPNIETTTADRLLPANPTLDNFARLFENQPFAEYLRNSLIVTAASVLISLVIGSLAAYALARFRLWLGLERRLGLLLLLVRVLPPIVLLVPMYLLILRLDLLNSLLGLVLVYSAFNIAFVVWMMESFFREIPADLEEAALVDGNTRLQAFVHIVLPVARPGLAATAIFAVIVTFNEFLFALALTSTPDAMTVPRGTGALIGRTQVDWGSIAAAGVVGAVPIVILALLVQRHLVRGLTLGAVK